MSVDLPELDLGNFQLAMKEQNIYHFKAKQVTFNTISYFIYVRIWYKI